jgi:hypothetical protein
MKESKPDPSHLLIPVICKTLWKANGLTKIHYSNYLPYKLKA